MSPGAAAGSPTGTVSGSGGAGGVAPSTGGSGGTGGGSTPETPGSGDMPGGAARPADAGASQALGTTCGDDGDCLSGHCVSGLCCATACEKSAEAACGPSGLCESTGAACKKYGTDTVCMPETCGTEGYTPPRLCDGQGQCQPASAPRSCGGFPCEGSRCRMTCATNADCSTGNYCSGGMCVAKKAVGDSAGCQDAAECMSGFCVANICCNTACTGPCTACTAAKTGKADGMCLPAKAGTPSERDCPAASQSSCGNNGACDGKGGCQKYDSGVKCGDEKCSGDKHVGDSHCDGKGKCNQPGAQSCSGGNVCRSNQCQNRCGGDGECVDGFFCDGGKCKQQAGKGQACDSNSDCKNGNCVTAGDSLLKICCDKCNGVCFSGGVCRKQTGENCKNDSECINGCDKPTRCSDDNFLCDNDSECTPPATCKPASAGSCK